MRVDFLYFEDCPSHERALERLRRVISEEGVRAEIEVTEVTSEEQARDLRFAGSPTIQVEGRDISPPPEPHYTLTCRTYQLENGRLSPLPSETMIRAAIEAATTG